MKGRIFYDRATAAERKCPRCHALPGQPCQGKRKERESFHQERFPREPLRGRGQ